MKKPIMAFSFVNKIQRGRIEVACPNCEGTGRNNGHQCWNCLGKGKVRPMKGVI